MPSGDEPVEVPVRGMTADGTGKQGKADAELLVEALDDPAHRKVEAKHPDVAGIVDKLRADKEHPLDLTRALGDDVKKERTYGILTELADGKVLAGRGLDDYRAASPGRGPLFEAEPVESTKDQYVARCKDLDPARRVGVERTDDDYVAAAGYARRLHAEVLPEVQQEVRSLAAAVEGDVSVRVKRTPELLDKVDRMVEGTAGRAGREGYEVGDVIDAVGARITVPDTERLERVVDQARSTFGDGRLLELENMYAEPKSHNPAYRVVALVVAAEVNGQPYTYELQLCTRRASVASDLEHNTIYKQYVDVTPQEQERVRQLQAEAAALDQEETRGRHA